MSVILSARLSAPYKSAYTACILSIIGAQVPCRRPLDKFKDDRPCSIFHISVMYRLSDAFVTTVSGFLLHFSLALCAWKRIVTNILQCYPNSCILVHTSMCTFLILFPTIADVSIAHNLNVLIQINQITIEKWGCDFQTSIYSITSNFINLKSLILLHPTSSKIDRDWCVSAEFLCLSSRLMSQYGFKY